MSEISVQFKNQLNGYNKKEVDLLLKKIEEELQHDEMSNGEEEKTDESPDTSA